MPDHNPLFRLSHPPQFPTRRDGSGGLKMKAVGGLVYIMWEKNKGVGEAREWMPRGERRTELRLKENNRQLSNSGH